MNRLAHWMMRLYPARWRRRYGDELDALLADSGADARVVADLFKGGVRMQFSTWSFPKLALALGIGGVILGAGLALLLPSVYKSQATLVIMPAGITEGITDGRSPLNEQIQQMEESVVSRTSLSRMINDPRLLLYTSELKTTPLEDVIEEMKTNIRVDFVSLPGSLGKRGSAFNISFSYPDRFKAQQTVHALMSAFVERNFQAHLTASKSGALAVVDAASLPFSPVYPSRVMVMMAGFVFGVIGAGIWRMVQRTGFIARRFALVAVALGIACMVLVIVGNTLDLLPSQRYRSTATLRLPGGNSAQIHALEAEAISQTSLSGIISDPRLALYKNQLRTMPLESVIQNMKRHLAVTPKGGGIFTVSFDYPDRYKAEMTVDAVMNRLEKTSQQLYSGGAPPQPLMPAVMDVLDPASMPITPVKPNRYMIAASGGIAGLAAAAVIAIIRRRWRPDAEMPVDAVHQ